MNCRICGSAHLADFVAREMMFGTKEEFVYQECHNCKSVQIKDIPTNLEKYYPKDYNAYHKHIIQEQSTVKYRLKQYLAEGYLLGKKDMLTKFLVKKFGVGPVRNLKYSNCNLKSNILDVGCGNGARLYGLAKYGFTYCVGIDPYLEKENTEYNSVKLYKQDISQHIGKYDLIMFNHVFEHVISPENTLDHVNRLLAKNGRVQISIPISGSYAWRKYRENWVGLDAPRHLHLFSKEAIMDYVRKFGFEVYHVLYDSSEYQFWGSQQFLKGIATRDKISYYENPDKSIFSKSDIKKFKLESEKLNNNSDGDTATFFLKRKSS